MPRDEVEARAYCRRIGADPDVPVSGYADTGGGFAVWARLPRWRWYRGACEAAHRRPK